MRTVACVCRHRHKPYWTPRRWHRARRYGIIAIYSWTQNIGLVHAKHWPVSVYCVWVCVCAVLGCGCGRHSNSTGLFTIVSYWFCSFVAVGIAVVDISAENIAGRPRSAAAAARSNCIWWLRHRVRCHIGAVRSIAITELVLSAGVCTSVFIFGEITAGSCNTGPVSKCGNVFSFSSSSIFLCSIFIPFGASQTVAETKYTNESSFPIWLSVEKVRLSRLYCSAHIACASNISTQQPPHDDDVYVECTCRALSVVHSIVHRH